jgi:methyltransferase family protein
MNVQLRELSASPHAGVSQASYWTPDLITGSAWLEHAPFGFWMVDALRPRTIVELGVHGGFSYSVFCQAVQRLHLSARCFAIDTWRGDEHAGYYGDDVYAAVCWHNRRYDSFSRLIRSDFADACDEFADGSIDLLHIDGCHSYEAVQRDFETWLPKVSKRGIILFHDVAEYANGFGVHRLWEELRTRYPSFEFRHGHGLGVIGVGEKLPASLRDLFGASASPASAQAIRAAYERLGSSIGALQKLSEQEREMEALRRQVRHLESAVESYEASTSWRVTAPLRSVARLMNSANGVADDLRDTLDTIASPPARPVYRADH